MKITPSGTIRLVALVGIGLATIITLGVLQSPAAKPDPEDVDQLVLLISKKAGEYHELVANDCATENKFINLLNTSAYSKKYKVHFKHKDPSVADCDLPDINCPQCKSDAQMNIKTDQIIVAKAPQNLPAGDPHVTTQVACKSRDDLKAVLDLLAP